MTCSNRAPEDQHEFALVVRQLVRLRHHQGQSVVDGAVKEAAQLDWRFCGRCGSETPWAGSVRVGCGLKQVGPRERLDGK